MIVLVFLAALVLMGLYTRVVRPRLRRRRMAAELHRDWWPRFERELRDYEARWRARPRG